jgi:homoprotocatechuate degradation regulator HpaR
MDPSTEQFFSSLPMKLYRALDAVMPRFRRIFRDYGITEQQWRVLRVLWEHKELASRDLADTTLIPASSLVGVVDRLQNRGLVDRRRDEVDRRGVFVAATESGRALEAQVMPRVEETYQQIRESVDSATWKQLLHGLDCVCALDDESDSRRSAVNK